MQGMMRGIMSNFAHQQQNLDSFVADSVGWPSNKWDDFVINWKYRDVLKMLQKSRSHIDNVLHNHLNCNKQSIPYSYLLGFKTREPKMDGPTRKNLLSSITFFIKNADKTQVCLAPRAFSDCLRFFSENYKGQNQNVNIQLIHYLKKSIELLQNTNKNILTCAHADLMYCCVKTYCYNQAFPIIEQDIIEVQGNGCVRALDNLRYHYYCGLIYIGVKKYRKALESLSMVCTSPSESLSVYQIEAYKKYVLISLILNRKLVNLPRYTPRILTRYFSKFCNEYQELAAKFSGKKDVLGFGGLSSLYSMMDDVDDGKMDTDMNDVNNNNNNNESKNDDDSKDNNINNNKSKNKIQDVEKVVKKYSDQFIKDKNIGLIKQVMFALKKDAVIKLTSVYTRLSIDKVTELCKFKNNNESKDILIKMIQKGELSASIDHNNVVTFKETLSESDREMLFKIHSRINNMVQLWNGLDIKQLNMKKTEKYIKKSLNIPQNDHDLQSQLLQSVMGGPQFFGRGN